MSGFVFFCLASNYGVCDSRSAIKQCNFENNYRAFVQKKVSSFALVPYFSMHPRDFPLQANLYQKLLNFVDFASTKPIFLNR